MRFAGNTSNVSSWIQAGKAGAKGAADAFKAARANAPDYGGLAEANMKSRSAERQAVTDAEAYVAQAGIKAKQDVKLANIKVDAEEKILDKKIDAKRMAGMVGMFGAVAGGGILAVQNNQDRAKEAQREADEERRWQERLEILKKDTTVEPEDVEPYEPSSPPEYTPPSESDSDSDSDTDSDTSDTSVSQVSSTITEKTDIPFTRQNVYSYLTGTKGLSPNKALGLMANIDRESSFRTAPPGGDNGNSFGALQWNNTYGRSDRMKANVPNWETNWKGQLDYALSDKQLPEYNAVTKKFLSTTYGTAQEAADYFMTDWERPSDIKGGSAKHRGFLATYDFKQRIQLPSESDLSSEP